MRIPTALLLVFLGPAVAFAQDAPRRKSGLWEISMSSPQMPAPMVSRQCVDEKSDSFTARPGPAAAKCSKQSVRREGASVIVESVCQIEGGTATSRGVFSGDFTSAYKGEMVTKFSPPMHGMAETKMNFQAHLTGPCAPGQKPGVLSTPGTPGGRAGTADPGQSRRMAEEMMRKYQK